MTTGLTKTDLEQDLDTHCQNTVDDPECKDQGHRVDVQTQEPREGGDGKLDVDSCKVVLDHGQASLDERFEYSLIE
jgi:hypothetical protein